MTNTAELGIAQEQLGIKEELNTAEVVTLPNADEEQSRLREELESITAQLRDISDSLVYYRNIANNAERFPDFDQNEIEGKIKSLSSEYDALVTKQQEIFPKLTPLSALDNEATKYRTVGDIYNEGKKPSIETHQEIPENMRELYNDAIRIQRRLDVLIEETTSNPELAPVEKSEYGHYLDRLYNARKDIGKFISEF